MPRIPHGQVAIYSLARTPVTNSTVFYKKDDYPAFLDLLTTATQKVSYPSIPPLYVFWWLLFPRAVIEGDLGLMGIRT